MHEKREVHEEHMLVNIELYFKLLNQFDLSDVTVVEFGAGDGALTELILKRQPKKIIAYELSEPLAQKLKERFNVPELEIRMGDFTKENFSYLNEGVHVMISNPPYSTIPFLFEEVINPFNIQNVIMMTSAKKRDAYFCDYELAFALSGDDFSPPAQGEHFVMQKGFDDLIKNPSFTMR